MNQALENLLTRRSCRKYDEMRQVEKEQLDQILLAGMYAPTAKNMQTPVMVVLQKKEDVRELEKLNAAVLGNPDARTFYGAPTVVVVFGKVGQFCLSDANLVIGNLLNAANAVGVDSCYIWRAKEAFESEQGKALMKKWGVPDDYVGAGNVILGYGLEGGKRPATPRKESYVIIV